MGNNKKITCQRGGIIIKKKVKEVIEKKIIISKFEKDREAGLWVQKKRLIVAKETVYIDRSSKEEKTAFGVWRKRGELQEMIYNTNSAPPNMTKDIKIDNSAVVRLVNKIKKGKYLQ
jgi:hypothetical protein